MLGLDQLIQPFLWAIQKVTKIIQLNELDVIVKLYLVPFIIKIKYSYL